MGQILRDFLRVVAIAGLAGLVVACADDGGDEGEASGEQATESSADTGMNGAADDTDAGAAGPDPQKWAADNQAYLEENAAKEDVTVTDSGLQYRVLEEGEAGATSPDKGDVVTVHYSGRLIDGTEFDSSYLREEPATFRSDRLIAGWVEALPMMTVGDKWELTIPPELAYGEAGAGEGRIPPDSTLIFEIELLDVAASESTADNPSEGQETEDD